jgi:hypothetical protein
VRTATIIDVKKALNGTLNVRGLWLS